MREKSIPSICAPIAYLTLCVSTALTLMFMTKLAGDDKILAGVFVLVGIIIEVIKAILPIVIFFTFAKKQWAFACVLAAMYLVMAAISFSSSAAALEERINQSLSVSVESATNLDKIEIVKQEVNDKRVLFSEQQAADQVSKMDTTSAEISQLNTQLLQLMTNSQNAQDTVLSRYKELLIYSIAGLIEVISPVMALIIMLNDTKRVPRREDENELIELVQKQGALLSAMMDSQKEDSKTLTVAKTQGSSLSETVTAPFVISATEATNALQTPKNSPLTEDEPIVETNVYQDAAGKLEELSTQLIATEMTTATNNEQSSDFVELYEAIKTKVFKKVIKPTFRDISTHYKLNRDEITHLLKMMEDEGVLARGKGNRYTVAA
ncbi:hypothetical protein OTK49_00905 [Vibrio coralliirubri]|uniref:hypothetical protein n=1 Tax=Vibrio coralliirubri TaxID=1516159 RepID=UPI002284C41E|nr:hypothetical protein [Vibrio coralliirubri]MCY9861090.1 hypothetical protein [Vibrio coralliirubri]